MSAPYPWGFFARHPEPVWRFVVTDLSGVVLTFLDRLATSRTVTLNLNAPSVATADVPSDNAEVNNAYVNSLGILTPNVSMNDKLLYGFRRDQPEVGGPYVVRFGGILQQVNDEIDVSTDVPTTHLTATDAWGYLNSLPILDADGQLPGTNGVSFNATHAYYVVRSLLENALEGMSELLAGWGIDPADVPTAALNMFLNFDQDGLSPYFTGATDLGTLIPSINFAQGSTIGAALTQIVQAGYLDIIMSPVWDQHNQPGIVSQLECHDFAGVQRPGAWFGWDRPGRSLTGMNRLQDGSQQANVGVGFAGSAGVAVIVAGGATAVVKESIKQYGPYWLQTQFPTMLASNSLVQTLMAAQLVLMQLGQQTTTIDVAPEFAPRPLIEYGLGDRIPIMWSKNFRQAFAPKLAPAVGDAPSFWTNFARVYSIPFVIADDGPESVSALVVTPPALNTTSTV